jgi:hypothetical protein
MFNYDKSHHQVLKNHRRGQHRTVVYFYEIVFSSQEIYGECCLADLKIDVGNSSCCERSEQAGQATVFYICVFCGRFAVHNLF